MFVLYHLTIYLSSVYNKYFLSSSGYKTLKPERTLVMEAILIGSIIASIIAGLGAFSIVAMYVIYRLTGGKKSFLWYIRHI